MRRTFKKFLASALAVAMITTSISTSGLIKATDVKAATLDLSGVTVTENIVNGGEDAVKEALTADTYTIDGVTYNNYVKYDGLSATASSEKKSAAYAIDGVFGDNRWESEWSDNQYIIIDLGNAYKVKDIAIFWEGASAKTYTIEVSADGSEFQTVGGTITSDDGERTDDIKFSSEIEVRAIKINGLTRTTTYGFSIRELAVYGSDAQKEVVNVLSSPKVCDYSEHTGKYFVYFNKDDNAESYNLYVDSKDTVIKNVSSSGSYFTADDLKAYATGEHTLYVAAVDENGNETATVSTAFTITGKSGSYSDIPQIYINTPESITRDYHDNADITLSFVDKDGGSYSDVIDCASNMKIRGNTTSQAQKKPWNIKLNKKKDLFGMGKGKKWCLLANAFDRSLLRNKLALDMGLENGVTYTGMSQFVDVYLNGEYQGSYLLAEPVEAKENRVEIDAYSEDDPESNDILLELGTRYESDVRHFTTDVLDVTFDINDPEMGEMSQEDEDAKVERVIAILNNFETALKGNDYDAVLEYMDEDTFVDFYIVCEYFKNVDFNYSSTRFYIKDNKIYAGPLWDFDLSSGNINYNYGEDKYNVDYYGDDYDSSDGYFCQSMKWYAKLFENYPSFYNKVKARYAELQYVIQNIYKEGSNTSLSIDALLDEYGTSFERNYASKTALGAGWGFAADGADAYSYANIANWTTLSQPVKHLRTWLEDRNEWLCSEWDIDMQQAYIDSAPEGSDDNTGSGSEGTETPGISTVPEAVSVNWDEIGYLGNGSGNAAYTDALKVSTTANVVNIQPSAVTQTASIYTYGAIATSMTINGVESTDVDFNGDQAFIYASAFTQMYNDVVLYNANGEAVSTIYVYNANGIDNSSSTDEPGTGDNTGSGNEGTDTPDVPDTGDNGDQGTDTPDVTPVETNMKITKVTWNGDVFDVFFTAHTEEAGTYVYMVYLDQVDADHAGINKAAGWNWKSNLEYINKDTDGFSNDFKFDGVFTTASEWATKGAASTYLAEGEHKVIVAVYANAYDAAADTNVITTVEQALVVGEDYVDESGSDSGNDSGNDTPVAGPTISSVPGTTFTGYVGSDWAGTTGTVAVEGDAIVANVNYAWGGWADAIWAVQATMSGATVATGKTYTYTATVTSTVDKVATVKISTATTDGLVTEKITLKANTPYTYSVDFVADADKAEVVWALGSPDGEGPLGDVTIKIDDISVKEKVVNNNNNNNSNVDNSSNSGSTTKPLTLKRTKVKKVIKAKRSSKKVKITLKKIAKAKGYQVKVSTNKKFKKKNTVTKKVKKVKFAIKSKKIKGAKKLYVKARAYNGKTYGKWSKVKKIKVKK